MISIDGLAVEFGGTTLFSDISFVINEKDRIALMGKNGAGKSTLLKILAGVRQPTRGKISAPKDSVIAYLPQHLMTEDGRTVFQEAAQAFAHLHEMEAEIERLNKELETRTDYESDSYMELIENVSALSEKFYAIDSTNYEEDVEKALLGLGFVREDFNRRRHPYRTDSGLYPTLCRCTRSNQYRSINHENGTALPFPAGLHFHPPQHE